MSLPDQKRDAFDRLGWALQPDRAALLKIEDAIVLWELADQERDANYQANLNSMAEVTAWGEAWRDLADKHAARITELEELNQTIAEENFDLTNRLEELEDESLAVDRAIEFLKGFSSSRAASESARAVVARYFEKALKEGGNE